MWQLTDNLATFRSQTFAFAFDLNAPWHGLQDVSVNGASYSGEVMRVGIRDLVDQERLLQEAYIRGHDLIATYAPSSGRSVQTQIYLRFVPPGGKCNALGIELILSAQTHLLDSRPATTIQSSTRGEVICFDGAWQKLSENRVFDSNWPVTLFILRPDHTNFSLVQMIDPSDFTAALYTLNDRVSDVSFELFPDRLEKGVIRRARTCLTVVPRANDDSIAVAAYERFLGSPLPLTT